MKLDNGDFGPATTNGKKIAVVLYSNRYYICCLYMNQVELSTIRGEEHIAL